MNEKNPVVTIISTGSELTSGKSIDTNSSWIAGELFEIGIQTEKFIVLPDSFEILKKTISNEFQMKKNQLVIITGGLGATEDDYTLGVISSILNQKTARFEPAFQRLQSLYEKRGKDYLSLIPNVERQTRYPEDAIPLENNVGIAVGFIVKFGENSYLAAMPGVPLEMKSMFQNKFIPALEKIYPKKKLHQEWRWIWGIGESYFQNKFIEVNRNLFEDGVVWGVTAKAGYVKVFFQSDKKEKVEFLIQKLESEFEKITTTDIFSEIHKTLSDSKKTLGTAESCTGGLIAKKITDLPGASAYFLGSIVSYHNDIKLNSLFVKKETLEKFGAVSSETAGEMTVGLEKAISCDYSMSVTGIAGPDGATPSKKTGLCYIGVKQKGKDPIVEEFSFPFTRELFRECASNMALFCLYKQFLKRSL